MHLENFERATRIIELVCERFLVCPADLERECREPQLVTPRSLAMALIRSHTSYSNRMIGILFNRDHTTVAHALKNVEKWREVDKKVIREWDGFLKELNPLWRSEPDGRREEKV